MSGRREFGDFQTPPELARAALATLGPIGSRWTRLLEPTCGTGSFLRAALAADPPPVELIGIDVDVAHCAAARSLEGAGGQLDVKILTSNIFDLNLRDDLPWIGRGPLLVVGNPPWVTSAALGRLESTNRPGRRNLKSLPGLAARTGASNFDLAEAVWIKLIEELAEERPTIALLCKTAVARAVLEHAHRRGLPIEEACLHEIDAARWFGASVRACFFRMTLGPNGSTTRVPVYAALGDASPRQVMEFRHGRLIADAEALRPLAFALGTSPVCWRQGIKHDAAAVMELSAEEPDGPFRNRAGEIVDVEPAFVYPLHKAADLRKPAGDRPRRALLVPQRRLGEPTAELSERAPRLWGYLRRHAGVFAARKSSIYRGQPPFALFGVGPYSFSPWKVAVSGLHRPALFRAIGPVEGRPVLLDDTCYLLPCDSPAEAALLAALCQHRTSLGLIEALSFPGSKRPLTKGLLQRLDLSAILRQTDRAELIDRATTILAEAIGERIDPTVIEDQAERLERRFQPAAPDPDQDLTEDGPEEPRNTRNTRNEEKSES